MTQPADRLWTKNFVLLLISAVFMYIAMFQFTPTLPLFARNLGVTDPTVGGLIVFLYTLGALLPRVWWGQLADRRGRRLVYLLGAVLMLVGTPLLGVFGTLWGVLLFRMVQGVGFSASSTAAATMAVDLTPASRRAEGVGYYSMANTVGMAVGPALGLFALQWGGNQALLISGTAAGLVCLGIGWFLRYEKPKTAAPSSPAPKSGLIEKTVLRNAAVMFFLVLPYGGIMAYIASYGTDRGVAEIGLYFSVYAVAVFLIRLVSGKLADRWGTTAVVLPALALTAAAMATLWFAGSLPAFLVSAALFGVGYGTAVPALQSSAFVFCPPERRGSGNATMFTVADLALGLGALLMGWEIKLAGYSAAFASFAVFALVAAALYLALLHRPLEEHRRTKTSSAI